MRDAVPVAFYAPLKSPHHPAPSGDRTMARLLMRALDHAGFAPDLVSELRTFDPVGDPGLQAALREASQQEAARLVERWSCLPPRKRPRLWFTYHVYYKAPDWIGPRCADALGIPYVVAEGSRAGKRATGPWSLAHRGAEAALDRAERIFVMTAADREMLEKARPRSQRLVDLPPFIDVSEWDAAAEQPKQQLCRDGERTARLLAVAMMRPGDKLASYRLLADALAALAGEAWSLDLVGDGEARREVEAMFAGFGPRIRFHGCIDGPARLAELYQRADLLVWPAVNEAYGMALLEAQLHGCPVLAGAYGGVASVVEDGRTGILVAPGDRAAFTRALADLLRDPARRRGLGKAARAFVRGERGPEQAAVRLRAGLMPLLEAQAVP